MREPFAIPDGVVSFAHFYTAEAIFGDLPSFFLGGTLDFPPYVECQC